MDLYSDPLRLRASLKGSLADSAVDWSSRGEMLQIHSIFKRVINIVTPKGLISVVSESIGRSPSYIVLDGETDFLNAGINTGEYLKVDGKSLVFDNLIVDLSSAGVWNDLIGRDFRWKKSDLHFKNLMALKSSIDRYAAPGSVWVKLGEDPDLKKRVYSLKGRDPVWAVKELVGLGPGLTPSGDDILLGFLAVINTCGDFVPFRNSFINEILSRLEYTSDISRYFLRLAAANYYHEYIQNLIWSVTLGLPENVLPSVKELVKIGATSGSDIAAGIYFGFSE